MEVASAKFPLDLAELRDKNDKDMPIIGKCDEVAFLEIQILY
jgi:hypothetical protein